MRVRDSSISLVIVSRIVLGDLDRLSSDGADDRVVFTADINLLRKYLVLYPSVG